MVQEFSLWNSPLVLPYPPICYIQICGNCSMNASILWHKLQLSRSSGPFRSFQDRCESRNSHMIFSSEKCYGMLSDRCSWRVTRHPWWTIGMTCRLLGRLSRLTLPCCLRQMLTKKSWIILDFFLKFCPSCFSGTYIWPHIIDASWAWVDSWQSTTRSPMHCRNFAATEHRRLFLRNHI